MGEFVAVTTDEHGVATIRLDRPPVNALSPQVYRELWDAARTCTEDDRIAAVVVWGGPKVFAAGADIKAMAGLSFQEFFAHGDLLQESMKAMARIPKVVIAAVNGYALGGGCELALATDFRYADDDATFGQPEIKLGIIPGAGGTQRLPRVVGVQRAKEMIYSGDLYSAQDCLAMGLADRVFPAGEVYDRAVEAARRYAAGPYALRMAKKAIDEGAEMDIDSALRLETTLFTATFATDDQRAGMRAFIAKAKPDFHRR
ncbi:MAG: enoyl-CoA hydratase/isomerase family protein [Egibacteraceae bacterium]